MNMSVLALKPGEIGLGEAQYLEEVFVYKGCLGEIGSFCISYKTKRFKYFNYI